MILSFILLIVGFVFLVKGADMFVDGSSSVAKLLKVPSIIIGLTIVAMGTSAPEAAVSITAAINGANDISFGNVIGSNFFNLLIVVGICAMFKPMKVDKNMLRSEFPQAIIIQLLLLIMCLDTFLFKKDSFVVGHIDGIILLLLFAGFITMQVLNAKKAIKNQSTSVPAQEDDIKVMSPLKSIIFIIISFVWPNPFKSIVDIFTGTKYIFIFCKIQSFNIYIIFICYPFTVISAYATCYW